MSELTALTLKDIKLSVEIPNKADVSTFVNGISSSLSDTIKETYASADTVYTKNEINGISTSLSNNLSSYTETYADGISTSLSNTIKKTYLSSSVFNTYKTDLSNTIKNTYASADTVYTKTQINSISTSLSDVLSSYTNDISTSLSNTIKKTYLSSSVFDDYKTEIQSLSNYLSDELSSYTETYADGISTSLSNTIKEIYLSSKVFEDYKTDLSNTIKNTYASADNVYTKIEIDSISSTLSDELSSYTETYANNISTSLSDTIDAKFATKDSVEILTNDVYKKSETYTQDEVNNKIQTDIVNALNNVVPPTLSSSATNKDYVDNKIKFRIWK